MSDDYIINKGSKRSGEVIKEGKGKTYKDQELKPREILEVKIKFRNIFNINLIRDIQIQRQINNIKDMNNIDLVYSFLDEKTNTWTYQIEYTPDIQTASIGTIVAISLGSLALISISAYLIYEIRWKIKNPLQSVLDWKLISAVGLSLYALSNMMKNK
jgi:hypothetical protein